MDLEPEKLQAALNVTVVGGLVASQQVSTNKKELYSFLFNFSQVLPAMLKNGKGTILFTGATASLRGAAQFGGFAASKFALRALAQSMARELGPKGIHVAHIIIDGQINTPYQVQGKVALSFWKKY